MPGPERNRGTKRKRPADEEDGENKLRRKLHHDIREVRKAAKKAKTFEVQKTLKKLKDARRKDSEGEATKDLEAQVEILKHIDCDKVANTSLLTKIKKDKLLSDNAAVQSVISSELAPNLVVPGTRGTPMAKVQSRLLSSKFLASEVASIVEALRFFLNPSTRTAEFWEAHDNEGAAPNTSKKKKLENARTKGLPAVEDHYDNGDEDDSASEGGDTEGEGAEEAAVDGDGWESATVSDGGASAAGDWESGSVDSSDLSAADDHDDQSDDPPDDPPPPKSLKSKPNQPSSSKGESAFLPSLSVGFTRGDSDSDFSDSEVKVADGIKKNRRGQRARRAIWEKKFGKNANHVKKQHEIVHGHASKPNRPAGTASAVRRSMGMESSARGYTSQHPHSSSAHSYPGARGGYQGNRNQRSQMGQAQSSNGGASRPPHAYAGGRGTIGEGGDHHERTTQKRDERPLHPSWEAKKKQKSAGIVPSQGTKIVFS